MRARSSAGRRTPDEPGRRPRKRSSVPLPGAAGRATGDAAAPAPPLPRRVLTAVWWSVTAPLTVAGVACAFLLVGTGAALTLTGFAGGVAALVTGQQPRRAPAAGRAASIAAAGLLVGV